MGMEDPILTFSYLATKIGLSDLVYLHVIELRVNGSEEREDEPGPGESNDFSRVLWAPRLLISAGGYTREDAMKVADERGVLVAFGRYFISNPDLPKKWEEESLFDAV